MADIIFNVLLQESLFVHKQLHKILLAVLLNQILLRCHNTDDLSQRSKARLTVSVSHCDNFLAKNEVDNNVDQTRLEEVVHSDFGCLCHSIDLFALNLRNTRLVLNSVQNFFWRLKCESLIQLKISVEASPGLCSTALKDVLDGLHELVADSFFVPVGFELFSFNHLALSQKPSESLTDRVSGWGVLAIQKNFEDLLALFVLKDLFHEIEDELIILRKDVDKSLHEFLD